MSGPALDWAWQQDLPPGPKLVLLALVRHVRSDLGSEWEVWPSQQTLARACSLSTRQVRTHLAALQTAGLIIARHRPGDGKGRLSTVYQLAAPQSALRLNVDNPVDKPGRNRKSASACRGGQPEVFAGQPEASFLRNPEEVSKRRDTPIPNHSEQTMTTGSTTPPANCSCYSQWREDAAGLRPDLTDDQVAASWAKFSAVNYTKARSTAQWQAAWRIWISNERAPASVSGLPRATLAPTIPQHAAHKIATPPSLPAPSPDIAAAADAALSLLRRRVAK